eukprot:scaffold19497_cov124-Cylindrotheca_fusiformis.AAC.2
MGGMQNAETVATATYCNKAGEFGAHTILIFLFPKTGRPLRPTGHMTACSSGRRSLFTRYIHITTYEMRDLFVLFFNEAGVATQEPHFPRQNLHHHQHDVGSQFYPSYIPSSCTLPGIYICCISNGGSETPSDIRFIIVSIPLFCSVREHHAQPATFCPCSSLPFYRKRFIIGPSGSNT